jgi:hypothetical protein
LVWKRLGNVSPVREVRIDFNYTPQRFGPADSGLYTDLEFLIALGHVEKGRSPGSLSLLTEHADIPPTQLNLDDVITPLETPAETLEEATEEALGFDYLMADEETAADFAAGERVEDTFRISDSGLRLLRQIEQGLDPSIRVLFGRLASVTAEVRSTYGHWALPRLLRFIYANYPEMTTQSEIRDRIMGSDT